MQLKKYWAEIKRVVERGQMSTLYCSIASVSPAGTPNITPIGTVFLSDDQTGFYFDQYTSQLAQNIDTGSPICLMAVNANKLYWLKSLLLGRFGTPPGVRLYGTVGIRRPATKKELEAIHRRIRPTRWLKGSQLLWSDFTHVREIHFTDFRPVNYPKMMDGLWK